MFGCIVDGEDATEPKGDAVFPAEFLARKRFRALSDGYKTAYKVSRTGALQGFEALSGFAAPPDKFYPEWCEDLAAHSVGAALGICLTRHGDLLVLDGGKLGFTYRYGRWQYWNHTHLVDLIWNAARVQNVPRDLLSQVVRAIYRASLDVSFRRSGGMFVLLRNRTSLHDIVRDGDAIGDQRRSVPDGVFDAALAGREIQRLERCIVAELAALDGAVVLSNKGVVLAYGSVLEPKRKGKVLAAEGSRTKAAIGSSNYGLSVKVSSDGDITVYVKGDEFLTV